MDGDAGKAWCAGKGEAAKGAWIEVRAEAKGAPDSCHLSGFVLVPGFAHDQATYDRNNRLKAYRIGTPASPSSAPSPTAADPPMLGPLLLALQLASGPQAVMAADLGRRT